MHKHILFALGTIALAACGDAPGNDTDIIDDETTAEALQPLPPTPKQEEMFTGRWRARDPETGNIMVHWEIRVSDDRWTGQYTLTEHFCQSRDETRASACPFGVQGGSWEQIQASGGGLIAKATDPFQTDALFTLTMLAPDGDTVTRIATTADLGFVQLNTEIERAPD
ncbi:MAG: hypothetical protein AAGK23_09695 [Pseudomonadota bacterium]